MLLLAWTGFAHAQNVQQRSPVTPGHVPVWVTSGVIGDSGTAAAPSLTNPIRSLGVQASGLGICQNSDAQSAAGYQQICLGVTTAGGAQIAIQNYGTASALPLSIVQNGVTATLATITPPFVTNNFACFQNTAGVIYDCGFNITGIVIGPGSSTVGDLVLWNNTLGTLVKDGGSGTVAGQYIWSGDQLFLSGRPWCDVRANGAKGDGVTDDTIAIQGCINNILSNWGAGIVYFPPSTSTYCTFTGITIASGVSTTGGVRLVGGGVQQSVLDPCGHDVTVLYMNSPYATLENMYVYGYGGRTTDPIFTGTLPTLPAISLASNCSFCKLVHVFVTGGAQNIQLQASGFLLDDVTVQYAFGDNAHCNSLVCVINGGGRFSNNHFDQVWPVSQPTHGATFAARANTTGYSLGDVVSVTCAARTWYLQASQAGTSAASFPGCKIYGQTITDGTVHWLLVKPATYYGLQLDTGSNENEISHLDTTGSFDAGIAITNTFAGTAPISTTISDSTPGGVVTAGILISAGGQTTLTGVEISNCIATGCAGINIGASQTGPVVINGLRVFNTVSYGVLVNGGTGTIIQGSAISSADISAITVAVNVNNFIIANNRLGSTNTNAVTVAAGTSDHYRIVNNEINGATTGIVDGGTGTDKFIAGNSTTIDIGMGNSLVFKGGAATFATLNATGLGIGSVPDTLITLNANSVTPALVGGELTHFIQANSSGLRQLFDSAEAGTFLSGRRANTSMSSPSALATDDTVIGINARGYGATGYSSGARAQILLNSAQTWTDTAQGAYIAFQTTPTGSTTTVEGARVNPSGGISIGTMTDVGAGAVLANTKVVATTTLNVGSATPPTLSTGEFGIAKITASGTAPGASSCKISAVAGTNANTCKLIAVCGTSATAVTVVDNVGGGC